MKKITAVLKNKFVLAAIAAVVVIAGLIAAFSGGKKEVVVSLKEDNVQIEAGSEFDVKSLIKELQNIAYEELEVIEDINTKVPGTYNVTFKADKKEWSKEVQVIDTTAPVIILRDGEIKVGQNKELTLDDIVESVADNADEDPEVTMKVTKGDLKKTGDCEITVEAKDFSGNVSSEIVKVKVTDEILPEIVLTNKEVTIDIGEQLDLNSFVAEIKDNGGKPALDIKVTSGSMNKAGECIVTYTVTDEAGNKAYATLKVHVIDEEPPVLVLKQGIVIKAGEKLSTNLLCEKVSDNGGAPKVIFKVLSGDTNFGGTVTVEVTAKDSAGNETVETVEVTVEPPVINEYGWDITGVRNQPYLAAVNRAMCTVTVYGKDEAGNYTVPVKAMACSVGRAGHATPTGSFRTTDKYRWRLMVDGTYGQYAIRINGSIMFHSVPYYTTNSSDMEYMEYNKLGSPASLGCVRLCVEDVYWLYANMPSGAPVVIYDDENTPGPLGKPDSLKIDENDEATRGWDPTDTAYGNPWRPESYYPVPSVPEEPSYEEEEPEEIVVTPVPEEPEEEEPEEEDEPEDQDISDGDVQ